MIKAIIFDCFGVLISDGFSNIVNEFGLKQPKRAARIDRKMDAANKGLVKPEDHRSSIANLLGLSVDEFVGRMRKGETKNYVLLDYIKVLHQSYKIGLLSNVIRGGLADRFSDEELKEHFDAVVASGDIGFAKPEAQAYEIIVDKLGLKLNECVMVDDVEAYCQGAVGVGMKAVRYLTFDQMKSELEAILGTKPRHLQA